MSISTQSPLVGAAARPLATVPEPATWLFLTMGSVASVALVIRRRIVA
jgi:hypothetical protein